jgi:hypothetical protein
MAEQLAPPTVLDESQTALATRDIHDIVEETTPPSPVAKIESGLSDFLGHTFEMVKEEDDYKKQIQAELLSRLPSLKSSELIALVTSASTNLNDQMSKIVSPTMQLLTAAQQVELAKQQKEQAQMQGATFNQNNIRELNATTPGEVLVGLQTLFNLAQATKKKEDSFVQETEDRGTFEKTDA